MSIAQLRAHWLNTYNSRLSFMTIFHEDVLKEVRSIHETTDASDFEDALHDAVMRVNTWGLEVAHVRHRTLNEDRLGAVLNPDLTQRFFSAMQGIQEAVPRMEPHWDPRDWLAGLYDIEVLPAERIRRCDVLCGYLAYLTLAYILDLGHYAAPYVMEGIVAAVEKARASF